MEDDEVDPDADLLVTWDLVPDPSPPESVIEAYQVIVENDEDVERLRVFAIDITAADTSTMVPSGFFEAGKDYEVEVLAIETSGNKTITEVGFATADAP